MNKSIQKFAKVMNRQFTKEDIHEADKHRKKCSSSLVFREMQIRTTLRYYLMPVRIVIIKKSEDNRCWGGCGEKREPSCTINGNLSYFFHFEKQFRDFSKKLKHNYHLTQRSNY